MTTTDIGRGEPQRRGPAGRDADSGLITLEWLLIVGAIAGLAATSALTVQRVLDDTSEVRIEPGVRFLDAEIAAAVVAAEATAWRRDTNEDWKDGAFGNALLFGVSGIGDIDDFNYGPFERACKEIETVYGDVVAEAHFVRPGEWHEVDSQKWPAALSLEYDLSDEDGPLAAIAFLGAMAAGEIASAARCEVSPVDPGLGG